MHKSQPATTVAPYRNDRVTHPRRTSRLASQTSPRGKTSSAQGATGDDRRPRVTVDASQCPAARIFHHTRFVDHNTALTRCPHGVHRTSDKTYVSICFDASETARLERPGSPQSPTRKSRPSQTDVFRIMLLPCRRSTSIPEQPPPKHRYGHGPQTAFAIASIVEPVDFRRERTNTTVTSVDEADVIRNHIIKPRRPQ
ncbi:hypothetical protein AB6A40_006760 [Gnathostoma spinigerum]|uniref:Uncharacterized protein n=1 Tax=Gnathostoma spinigerum TaxID=75299 RepID=A0ABD6ERI0_9BILA